MSERRFAAVSLVAVKGCMKVHDRGRTWRHGHRAGGSLGARRGDDRPGQQRMMVGRACSRWGSRRVSLVVFSKEKVEALVARACEVLHELGPKVGPRPIDGTRFRTN